MAVVITDSCISCGACIDECPTEAIVDEDDNPTGEDIYYVYPDKCVECLGHYDAPVCIEACPTEGCIKYDVSNPYDGSTSEPNHQENNESGIIEHVSDIISQIEDGLSKSLSTLDDKKYEIINDHLEAIKGGADGFSQLMNMDTSNMSEQNQLIFNYFKLKINTNMNTNESPINWWDKIDIYNDIQNYLNENKENKENEG